MTVETVKKMTIDNDCKAVVVQILKAKKELERIKSIILPIQQSVLDKHQFRVSKEYEDIKMGFITSPKDHHLLSDSDFQTFTNEVYTLYVANGFVLPTKDHCPLLMAESVEREANWKLIDVCEKYTGVSYNQLRGNLKNFFKFIDLILETFTKTLSLTDATAKS